MDAACAKSEQPGDMALHPNSARAAEINQKAFNALPAEALKYVAIDSFVSQHDLHPGARACARRKDKSKNSTQLAMLLHHEYEYKLSLKTDMTVIVLADLDPQTGLAAGTLGKIVGWEDVTMASLPKAFDASSDGKEPPAGALTGLDRHHQEAEIARFVAAQKEPKLPRVAFTNGVTMTIYPTCAVQYVGTAQPFSLLSRTQIPLVPGYALSIWRAQGMTLSKAVLDLRECGQGPYAQSGTVYTALSRVRHLQDVQVGTLPPDLRTPPEIAQFTVSTFHPDRLQKHTFDGETFDLFCDAPSAIVEGNKMTDEDVIDDGSGTECGSDFGEFGEGILEHPMSGEGDIEMADV